MGGADTHNSILLNTQSPGLFPIEGEEECSFEVFRVNIYCTYFV